MDYEGEEELSEYQISIIKRKCMLHIEMSANKTDTEEILAYLKNKGYIYLFIQKDPTGKELII